MKTKLVTRSVYANIIILIVTMAISGCFPIVEYVGARPRAIQAGTTSKVKIVKKFGYPRTKTSDGRFLLYDYSQDTQGCFILPGGGGCSPLFSGRGKVLIEFNNDNIVEQQLLYSCKKPPDPFCDQPDTDTMWMMINQLAGEDVAAQYGQTLDEYRQAEALRNSRTEALVKAVKIADIEAIKRLIDEGADVNAEDWIGSMLHKAAWYGHVGVIKLLLANGADVNAQDSSGITPLLEAVARSNVVVINLLLAKGADLNARDPRGDMPLHRAIRIGDTKVVQLLLTHGADANAKAKGWFNRPIKIARDLGGREGIIELLKQHGGKE